MHGHRFGDAWMRAVLGLLLLGVALACGNQDEGGRSAEPAAASASAALEVPGDVALADAIDPALRAGASWRVADPARADGLLYGFSLGVDGAGRFEVIGEDMLRVRIGEVAALKALRRIETDDTAVAAAIESAKAPFKAGKDLVTRPKDTLSGAGAGAKKAGSKAGRWLGGDRRERADSEDSSFEEAIGFSRCKRKLAHRLGVDVYSTNQRLQSELDRVCWATVGGGATFGAVMAVVPLGTAVTLVRHTTTFSDKMSELLVTQSGGDLYRMNRDILRGMGMPEASIESFLNDPQLSPRNKTIIVAALKDMPGVEGRHHVVSAGGRIRDAREALWFQRTVELSRGYHERVSPLQALYVDADQLFLFSQERDVVAVRAADWWMWTGTNRDWAESFGAFTPPGVEIRERRFWNGGRFSPAARTALDDLGIEAREDATACLEAEPARC